MQNKKEQTQKLKRQRNNTKKSLKKLIWGMEMVVFITEMAKSAQIRGPGKWPIVDLKYHADGDQINNLCSRISSNGITASTDANVKDINHKYHYKFIWTAWVKLPAGMVMKRYDYDQNTHQVTTTSNFQKVNMSVQYNIVGKGLESANMFIVNDEFKFLNNLSREYCFDYDNTCEIACNGNLECTYRCLPKTDNPHALCNSDPIKRCKTVGTESWFLMGADYSILEPTGLETCKLKFANFRATPNKNDGIYNSGTDCSDFTDPLRLHKMFPTERNDANSDITQNSDEIKLQTGYETITVKKRASAFVVLDKNQFYVTRRGNTGDELEIILDDVIDYYWLDQFYYTLASGEPTLHNFYDFTRWYPNDDYMKNSYFYYGTDADTPPSPTVLETRKKYRFEQNTPYGYRIHPNLATELPDSTFPFISTMSSGLYKYLIQTEKYENIDFGNHDFCATFSTTITILRKADGTLADDNSNSIEIEYKLSLRDSDTKSFHYKSDPFKIRISRINSTHVRIYYYEYSHLTEQGSVKTEVGAQGVDGIIDNSAYIPSTWPGQGYLELMAHFTICPTGLENGSTVRIVPLLTSVVIKDSEDLSKTYSAKPIGTHNAKIDHAAGPPFTTPGLKTLGMVITVINNPAANTPNLDYYLTNMALFKGGSSPTMIDVITTDTTTYPDYRYWVDHFMAGSPYSIIGGSRTSQEGERNPDDTIYSNRCTTSNPLSFLSGTYDSCLTASIPIAGCLRYRGDLTDPNKGVCERCDYESGYWLDKTNPEGECIPKTENPGVEVNCDYNHKNNYKSGECHTCTGVTEGCICNSNQVKNPNGTCSCTPNGCGICFESGGTACQFCFPVNIFLEHPDDAGVNPLVCVDISSINSANPGKGRDLTRSPPSLIDCTDATTECSFCADDATDCTKCSGTDKTNSADYFSYNGDCVLRSSLPAGVGFTLETSYVWRVVPCSIGGNCSDCYDAFDICQKCLPDLYIYDLDINSVVDSGEVQKNCTDRNYIPKGLGINEATKSLIKCLSTNCSNCALDFEDCSACVNDLLQSLTQSDVAPTKNKCSMRPLDPEPLENQVNPANSFSVEKTSFRDSTSTIKIYFNARCNVKVQTSSIRVQLFNADKSQEFRIEYLRGRLVDDSQTLALEVKIRENIENGVIIVKFMNVATFFEEGKPENTLNKASFEIKNINYYSLNDEKAVGTVGKITNGGLKITSILYYLVSTTTSLFLLKLFQMIDYLVFFNVDHPRNLKVYLGVMGKGPIEDIPNFFSFLADGKCDKVKERFSDEGMTCQIFQSYGNYFMIILAFASIKLIIMAIYHILDFFDKDPLWLRKLHFRFMGSRFWLDFLDAIQLDLYLNAMLALTSYKGGSNVAKFNYFFSLGMLLVALGGMIWVFLKIKFYQNTIGSGYETLDREKLDKLFANRIYSIDLIWIRFEYKGDKWYQKYHVLHNFIRDPVLALCMVFFHDSPLLQTTGATLIMLFSAVMDTKFWPFREKARNIVLIITGYMYVAINLFFFVLASTEGTMKKKSQYLYIGFLIITLISGIIFVDIGYATMEVWIKVKNWYKEKFKNKKKVEEDSNKNETPAGPLQKSQILNFNATAKNLSKADPEIDKNKKVQKKYEGLGKLSKIEEERSSQLVNSPNKIAERVDRKVKRGVTFKELELNQDNDKEVNILDKRKATRKMSFSPRKRSSSPKKSRIDSTSQLKFRNNNGVTVQRKRSGAGGFSAMLDE